MSIKDGLRLDDNGNPVAIMSIPSGSTTIKVDGTSASAATAAVIHATLETIVYIEADSDCYITAGASPTAVAPTATAGAMKQYAKTVQQYKVPPACKIAVIGGIIYITPHS